MLLLDARNIKKYYADRLIIEVDELKIYTGDRIGVVGLNGSGKTTLMDILSGSIEPDEGHVRRYCEVAYIRQFEKGETERKEGKLISEFELNQKLQRDGLSGGELTRLKIVEAFSTDNALLFADEPTSNLDYKGIELLKQKLDRLDSFVLISHDRSLLDTLCTHILEIRDGKVRMYNGNYTFYRQRYEMEQNRAACEYQKYISEKAALEDAISNRTKRAIKMRKAPKRMGNSEARLHTRAANEKQEKLHNTVGSLVTRLDKLEVKERPRELPSIKLDFSLTNPPENRFVITCEKLSFSYGHVPVFEDAGFRLCNGLKTALWGENGSGKTTLLNLIASSYDVKSSQTHQSLFSVNAADASRYVADSGSPNSNKNNACWNHGGGNISIVPKARIAYFRQGFENLMPHETVLDNVMSDSVQQETVARTILARLLLQGDAVHKRVEVLSGGEKIKTAFAKLFVSNANVLLMDEPTNYLDMKSIEALENVLKEYEGTVLFVSHDRSFVNGIAERLLVIKDKGIEAFDGGLEEYEEYESGKSSGGRNSSGSKSSASYSNGSKPCEGMVKDAHRSTPEGIERTMLQMRLTEIIAKLSSAGDDRDRLEEEYNRLTELLRQP
ncbi:MAG: ABC-F family ATP-binding cassette domain-containing protein [Clostridiaceae bacterium]|jgi:macrolide transport system ATP-binding/permease protein|nr:ABC-F family ATP-binding cassette domain-containing protein [Clostridiaceae bacterium]